MSKDHTGPVRVNGDPSLFHLILNYLRRGKLPIVTDVSQLQWLEAGLRAKYDLTVGARLCPGKDDDHEGLVLN